MEFKLKRRNKHKYAKHVQKDLQFLVTSLSPLDDQITDTMVGIGVEGDQIIG